MTDRRLDSVSLPEPQPGRFDYCMLPPRLVAQLRDRILLAHRHRKLIQIPRTE